MNLKHPARITDSLENRQLYRKYMREINHMMGLPRNDAEADELYEELIWPEHYDYWINIEYNHQVVGFFTMCPIPHCPPNVNYILRDAYVLPEYRRLGLMQTWVKEWLKWHPGIYEIYVINDNHAACNCWNKIFGELDYELIYSRPNTENGVECTFLRFQPRQLNYSYH